MKLKTINCYAYGVYRHHYDVLCESTGFVQSYPLPNVLLYWVDEKLRLRHETLTMEEYKEIKFYFIKSSRVSVFLDGPYAYRVLFENGGRQP